MSFIFFKQNKGLLESIEKRFWKEWIHAKIMEIKENLIKKNPSSLKPISQFKSNHYFFF